MLNTILLYIAELFNNNPAVATFVVACLPIFELRGAIPFGVNQTIWNGNSLSPIHALSISLFASTLVVIAITLLLPPLLKLAKNTKWFCKLTTAFVNKIKNKSAKINTSNKQKTMLGLFLFVSTPLPLTGVYTGTAIAVLLNLNFYQTLLCIGLGNIVAGIILTIICTLFAPYTTYILLGFFAIATISIAIGIMRHFLKQPKQHSIKE